VPDVSRGEVWLVDLPQGRGHEQEGTRPAVIVLDLRGHNTAVIVPTTKELATERFSHVYTIMPSKENGLDRESVAQAYQIQTITKERFIHKMGKLNAADIDAVMGIIANMLKLEKPKAEPN